MCVRSRCRADFVEKSFVNRALANAAAPRWLSLLNQRAGRMPAISRRAGQRVKGVFNQRPTTAARKWPGVLKKEHNGMKKKVMSSFFQLAWAALLGNQPAVPRSAGSVGASVCVMLPRPAACRALAGWFAGDGAMRVRAAHTRAQLAKTRACYMGYFQRSVVLYRWDAYSTGVFYSKRDAGFVSDCPLTAFMSRWRPDARAGAGRWHLRR